MPSVKGAQVSRCARPPCSRPRAVSGPCPFPVPPRFWSLRPLTHSCAPGAPANSAPVRHVQQVRRKSEAHLQARAGPAVDRHKRYARPSPLPAPRLGPNSAPRPGVSLCSACPRPLILLQMLAFCVDPPPHPSQSVSGPSITDWNPKPETPVVWPGGQVWSTGRGFSGFVVYKNQEILLDRNFLASESRLGPASTAGVGCRRTMLSDGPGEGLLSLCLTRSVRVTCLATVGQFAPCTPLVLGPALRARAQRVQLAVCGKPVSSLALPQVGQGSVPSTPEPPVSSPLHRAAYDSGCLCGHAALNAPNPV